MSTPRFAERDLVIVAPLHARPAHRGVVYRVERILNVNIEVVPVTGGRPLRANPDIFQPAPTAATPAPPAIALTETVPPPSALWPANVVTISGPAWKQPADQLWVVLRDQGTKVSVAKLGGDHGRYYRGVSRSYLTVVDPAHLTYTPPQP